MMTTKKFLSALALICCVTSCVATTSDHIEKAKGYHEKAAEHQSIGESEVAEEERRKGDEAYKEAVSPPSLISEIFNRIFR